MTQIQYLSQQQATRLPARELKPHKIKIKIIYYQSIIRVGTATSVIFTSKSTRRITVEFNCPEA